MIRTSNSLQENSVARVNWVFYPFKLPQLPQQPQMLYSRSDLFTLRWAGPSDLSRPTQASPSERKRVLPEHFTEVLHHRGYDLDHHWEMYTEEGEEFVLQNLDVPAWKKKSE